MAKAGPLPPLQSTGAIDNLAQVWAQIDHIHASLRGSVLTERPPDCFSIAEYAAHYKCKYTTAKDRLARLAESGQLECLKLYTVDRNGHQIVGNVYRRVISSISPAVA